MDYRLMIVDCRLEIERSGQSEIPACRQAGEAGRLQGIITDRDIRLALPSLAFTPDIGDVYLRLEDLKVHQVMTRDLYTTTPESPLAEAVDLCLRHTIGALPVLRDGTLVGIITETDLLRALRDRLASEQPRERA